mmetsp:Transcript_1527/g.4141  ORF Transcript_1527/g.4141 Transcript_1527/m.4141 type:complete len:203 (-) Transcript_1527:504-1112(-)
MVAERLRVDCAEACRPEGGADLGGGQDEAQCRLRSKAFSFAVPAMEGLAISPDRRTATRVDKSDCWRGAFLSPAVRSADRSYVEFVIEVSDDNCAFNIGVTTAHAFPADFTTAREQAGSRMYRSHNSWAYPGGRDWCGTQRRRAGERVGLLLEAGRLWVYVNGERLGAGPMASDVPEQVRFVVEIGAKDSRLRLIHDAQLPA